jgi:hypothetical protein
VTRDIPIEQMTSSELQRRKAELERRLAAPETSGANRQTWQADLAKVNAGLDELRKVGAIA